MIDKNHLAELLAGAQGDELDGVVRALIRERVIRTTMAQTGQGRDPVAEAIDAGLSTEEESVLDLTDGEPTTLADALTRYVEELDGQEHLADVAADLNAILCFPWSGEEAILATHLHDHYGLSLRFSLTEAGHMEVQIGSNRWPVATVLSDDSRSVNAIVQDTVMAVYRAILVRVIGDRDHQINLTPTDIATIREWLDQPSGSLRLGRLTLNAGGPGGGAIVRTRPYTRNSPLAAANRHVRES